MIESFNHKSSDIFIPDDATIESALNRTTHLAIGAHSDDLEIMAYHGIVNCYGHGDNILRQSMIVHGNSWDNITLDNAENDYEMITKMKKFDDNTNDDTEDKNDEIILIESMIAHENGLDNTYLNPRPWHKQATEPLIKLIKDKIKHCLKHKSCMFDHFPSSYSILSGSSEVLLVN